MIRLAAILPFLFVFATCKQDPKKNIVPETKVQTGVFNNYLDSFQLINNLKVLSADSMQGRKTGTEGAEKARNYITAYLKNSAALPFRGNYEQEFSFENKGQTVTGKNIIGYYSGFTFPGKYIVLSAHYDHLGVDENGQVFNGADDNASGVATLMSTALYLAGHAPLHSVILVFFDAEEQGLKGSEAFLKDLPVPLESVVFNINLDMISRSDKRELYFSGQYHYPETAQMTEPLQARTPVVMRFGHDSPDLGKDDWTSQSDHFHFHKHKIPYLYLGVEDHDDYHKVSDDFEKIDRHFFIETANLVVETLRSVDKHARR